jgi:heat shock 70kDa protein 1/2/6/8
VTTNPKNTIFNYKRFLGRRFSDVAVQSELRTLPYKVEQGPGDKPLIVVTHQKEVKKFYPEDIQAILLKYLLENAANYLGIANINKAVVTIPAYFSKP